MLFSLVQFSNEQKHERFHDSDSSDMIRISSYTSYDGSDCNDNASDDNPYCNDDDDHSTIFDDELYKSAELDENHYHHS